MQSPKFSSKKNHLRKLVAAQSLTKLWKSQIRDRMRKQLVPDAIEFLDFHIDVKKRTSDLESLICSGNYLPSPILRLTVEKSKGLCRQIALPDPADALVLQALSNSLWREISQHAPSKTAFYAQKDQPFSIKNKTSDDEEWGYGPISAWLDFQKEILSFSKKRPYIVVTDIANYYDFIIHNFLRAILSEYGLEKETALDILLFILDAMLWRPDYMPNFGIGLPQMDLDAPRLLAHTHLFEIDALFAQEPDVDYARYMDDIDFGVDSVAKAKTVLRDLDLALQTRNLRLNSGKTKILTSAEAESHFKVHENILIERLISKVAASSTDESRTKFYGKMALRILRSEKARENFETGNGDKLIKRLLTIVKDTKTPITDNIFTWLLYEKPGLRKEFFATWSRTGITKNQLDSLTQFLRSGEAIDDMVSILAITAMSNAVLTRKFKNSQFSALRLALKGSEPSLLYARLLLVSRFDTPSLLWSEIKDTVTIWSRHKFLSRQVAGFAPLFFTSSHWKDYETLVKRWAGNDGMSVFEFHNNLRNDISGAKAVFAFLQAENPSTGTKVTHAKSLMILSVVNNNMLSKIERAKLVGRHPTMMSDAYYQNIFSYALMNMK